MGRWGGGREGEAVIRGKEVEGKRKSWVGGREGGERRQSCRRRTRREERGEAGLDYKEE